MQVENTIYREPYAYGTEHKYKHFKHLANFYT